MLAPSLCVMIEANESDGWHRWYRWRVCFLERYEENRMQGTTIPPRPDEPSQPGQRPDQQPDQQPIQLPPPIPADQSAGQTGQTIPAPPGYPYSGYPGGYPPYAGYAGYTGQDGYRGMPPLPPVAVVDSTPPRPRRRSLAIIGAVIALLVTLAIGVVSRLNQVASEQPSGPAGTLTGLIQTSAPINPGNSGGALVNLQGQLIGIPTLAAINPESRGTSTSIGYAIASNRVQFVAQQLIANGKVTSTGQG